VTGWRTLRSRVTYQNPWIKVREDAVTRPDGEPGIYGVVEVRSPAVFVVPVTADGGVVLVLVDRYAIGRLSWEVPAGGADGEDLLTAAQRELREETGLAAAEWRDLGTVYSLNGVAAAPGRVFLATGLHSVEGQQTAAEGIADVRTLSAEELVELVADGTLTDNESLGALLKGLVALGRVSGSA
jgi:8-oxo-dGTP pyrophosphatase MutT (NUDIX family)